MLTTDAAARLSVSRRTIQRLSARHGLGRRVGHVLELSEADFTRLRQLVRQRVGWQPGNQNWRKRKGVRRGSELASTAAAEATASRAGPDAG